MNKPSRQRIGHKSNKNPEDVLLEVGKMQDLKVRIHSAANFFNQCPEFLDDDDSEEFQSMNEYFNFLFCRFFDDIEQHFFVTLDNKQRSEELMKELQVIDQELNYVEEYIDINQ